MKKLISPLLCLIILALASPALLAQDLSKYRAFSLGSNLTSVLKITDQKLTDVKLIHDRPALTQELTWWPINLHRTNNQVQSVERIVFSFYNGDLYKLSVDYDSRAIQGLTADDMIQTLSTMYGTQPKLAAEVVVASADRFDSKRKYIATWEDPLYSSNLVRSSYSNEFSLIAFAKVMNTQAETANASAVTLDEQERPQKEAAQSKKANADLELARQKNKKLFQP